MHGAEHAIVVCIDCTKAFDSFQPGLSFSNMNEQTKSSIWSNPSQRNPITTESDQIQSQRNPIPHENDSSKKFDVTNGVKQGFVLAPLLYYLLYYRIWNHAWGSFWWHPGRILIQIRRRKPVQGVEVQSTHLYQPSERNVTSHAKTFRTTSRSELRSREVSMRTEREVVLTTYGVVVK